MNLNELRDKAYKIACEHGFHDKKYSNEHWLMLVVTELSEAVDADRKNHHADLDSFFRTVKDWNEAETVLLKSWYSVMLNKQFEENIKDSIEDELADAVIRCLDFCGLKEFDLSETQEMIEDDEPDPCPDETDIMKVIMYNIISLLFNKTRKEELRVQDVIIQLFGLSVHLGIDLEWHINMKMKYNELRPRLHGKEY
jgi:NTP pyrophosphatase (non-canonical NTP hydrolase)